MRLPRRALLFLAGLAAAVLVAEIAVSLVSPPRAKREVEDGVRDLRASDPDILVISSSHGRSFHVLGEEIAQRTGQQVSLVAFAVEAGKLRPMEWVLRHRAMPLLDERDRAGKRLRTRTRDLILGVTWWDTCRREPPPEVEHNIVSRAWTWPDYLKDLAAHGITDLNRNFLRYQVQRVQRVSRLMQLQGLDTLQQLIDRAGPAIRARFARDTPANGSAPAAVTAVSLELARWRRDIETGHACLLSPSELAALERMEAFARERGLRMTVVLFPLMPTTVTAAGRETLQRFAELMRKRGQERGYRVVDMTLLPVLTDADFMSDMDHLSVRGNAKFVEWALSHELGFLLERRSP